MTACHTGNLQSECSHGIGYCYILYICYNICKYIYIYVLGILMHFSSICLLSTLNVKISWMQNVSVLAKCPYTVQSWYSIQRNPSTRDPCCTSPWKRKYSAWHGILLGTGIPALGKGRASVNCLGLAIPREKSSCFLHYNLIRNFRGKLQSCSSNLSGIWKVQPEPL